jgi:hypothetical protein
VVAAAASTVSPVALTTAAAALATACNSAPLESLQSIVTLDALCSQVYRRLHGRLHVSRFQQHNTAVMLPAAVHSACSLARLRMFRRASIMPAC